MKNDKIHEQTDLYLDLIYILYHHTFWHTYIILVCLSSPMPCHLQASFTFVGAASGPLLGIFLLGGLFPWANWLVGDSFVTNTCTLNDQFSHDLVNPMKMRISLGSGNVRGVTSARGRVLFSGNVIFLVLFDDKWNLCVMAICICLQSVNKCAKAVG